MRRDEGRNRVGCASGRNGVNWMRIRGFEETKGCLERIDAGDSDDLNHREAESCWELVWTGHESACRQCQDSKDQSPRWGTYDANIWGAGVGERKCHTACCVQSSAGMNCRAAMSSRVIPRRSSMQLTDS